MELAKWTDFDILRAQTIFHEIAKPTFKPCPRSPHNASRRKRQNAKEPSFADDFSALSRNFRLDRSVENHRDKGKESKFGYNKSDKVYIRKTKKEGETQDKEA